VFQKRTPKIGWHKLHQNTPVTNDFSQSTSAFNYGLIAREKLDMGAISMATTAPLQTAVRK